MPTFFLRCLAVCLISLLLSCEDRSSSKDAPSTPSTETRVSESASVPPSPNDIASSPAAPEKVPPKTNLSTSEQTYLRKYCAYQYLVGPGASHNARLHGATFVPKKESPWEFKSDVGRAIWEGDFAAIRESKSFMALMGGRAAQFSAMFGLESKEPTMPDQLMWATMQYVGSANAKYGSDQILEARVTSQPVDAHGDEDKEHKYFISGLLKEAWLEMDRKDFTDLLPGNADLDTTSDVADGLEDALTNQMLQLLGDAGPQVRAKIEPALEVRRDMIGFVETTEAFSGDTYQLLENIRRFVKRQPSLQEAYREWNKQHHRKNAILPLRAYEALATGRPVLGSTLLPDYPDKEFPRSAIAQLVAKKMQDRIKDYGFPEESLSKYLIDIIPMSPFDLRLLYESMGDTDEERCRNWNSQFGTLDLIAIEKYMTQRESVASWASMIDGDESTLDIGHLDGKAILARLKVYEQNLSGSVQEQIAQAGPQLNEHLLSRSLLGAIENTVQGKLVVNAPAERIAKFCQKLEQVIRRRKISETYLEESVYYEVGKQHCLDFNALVNAPGQDFNEFIEELMYGIDPLIYIALRAPRLKGLSEEQVRSFPKQGYCPVPQLPERYEELLKQETVDSGWRLGEVTLLQAQYYVRTGARYPHSGYAIKEVQGWDIKQTLADSVPKDWQLLKVAYVSEGRKGEWDYAPRYFWYQRVPEDWEGSAASKHKNHPLHLMKAALELPPLRLAEADAFFSN